MLYKKKLEFLCESRPFNDFNSKIGDVFVFVVVWNWLNLFDLQWPSHFAKQQKDALFKKKADCQQQPNKKYNLKHFVIHFNAFHMCVVCVIKGNLHLNKLCGSFTLVMQAKVAIEIQNQKKPSSHNIKAKKSHKKKQQTRKKRPTIISKRIFIS